MQRRQKTHQAMLGKESTQFSYSDIGRGLSTVKADETDEADYAEYSAHKL
jgi:hypothetical protein